MSPPLPLLSLVSFWRKQDRASLSRMATLKHETRVVSPSPNIFTYYTFVNLPLVICPWSDRGPGQTVCPAPCFNCSCRVVFLELFRDYSQAFRMIRITLTALVE